MEPDIMPMYSSSPPPLDDEDEASTEEDEDDFREFRGFCGAGSDSFSFPKFTHLPPSDLNQPSQAAAEHFANSGNRISQLGDSIPESHSVEKSQPTSTITTGVCRAHQQKEQCCNREHHKSLSNVLSEGETFRHSTFGTNSVSAPGAHSLSEEPGFVELSVFSETQVHPWCCGFTPSGTAKDWGDRAESTNREECLKTKQQTVTDCELRSVAGERVRDRTIIHHCEQRDTGFTHPPQDHRLKAPASLSFPSEVLDSGDEDLEDLRSEDRTPSLSQSIHLKKAPELVVGKSDEEKEVEIDSEEIEQSASPLNNTVSESSSEDFASFCDAVSPVGVEDFGDFVQTIDTPLPPAPEKKEVVSGYLREETEIQLEEERENIRDAGISPSQLNASLEESRIQGEEECSADLNQNQREVGDKDLDQAQDSGVREWAQIGLPPSDSFADFCSAPSDQEECLEGEAGGDWVAFDVMGAPTEFVATWADFGDPGSSAGQKEDETEDKICQRDTAAKREQASFSRQLHRLLQDCFHAVKIQQEKEEEEEEDVCVPSLGALLQHHDAQPEDGEKQQEEEEPHYAAHWVPRGVWRQPCEVHDAFGLKFQWGGSHSNRILLHCLGMDTRNILFTGQTKQPVIVPVFAANLGMLEPTKESVKAAGQTAETAQVLPGSQETRRALFSDSAQASFLTSQCDRTSSGLSNPQGGVDRELYELTTAKLEPRINSSHLEETFNRLMTSMEITSTATSNREPQQDKDLSAEAAAVVCEVPDLSFMRAKVLMFPSILIPPEGYSTALK
ncbi:aftiphilin isoform X2 [Hypomesus transpacificus]|uniref:aftiphilin isoform X2 n=1 Tax=Hypomesus transpacificus TaxID=137520 RepID=UPI001F087353|nr:aftiphilin isoform X2 [Hypomesus transpacificus]